MLPQSGQNLNPQQKEAVEHPEGPLLIVAGAGSGKTKTLTSRIAHLIATGTKPEQILAVTFTNKAAEEMRSRVATLVPDLNAKRLTLNALFIGTFHSWGAKMLRRHPELLGRTMSFSIFDEDDALRLFKDVVKKMDLDKERHNPSVLRWKISKIKNELVDVAELRGSEFAPDVMAAKAYDAYEAALAANNAFDFDDLIEKPVRIFEKYPDVLHEYQERYAHVLVDEYQDINTAQYRLIKLLAAEHHNLSVVGDDAQCVPPTTVVATPKGTKMIKDISAGDMVLAAAGDGKTCPAKVLRVHKMKYSGQLIKITTVKGHVIRLTPNHLIFTRLPLINDGYFVYLMYRKDKGFRIGIAKGVRWGRDGEGSIGLRVRSNQEKADKMWVLKICASRADAEYYEFNYAFRYGIPTVVFETAGRSMLLSQQHINRLYGAIDTKQRAMELMKKELLYFDYPHLLPQGTIRHSAKRLRVRLSLFDDRRKSLVHPWGMSRISVNTKDLRLKKEIERLGLATRKGKLSDWRLEIARLNYGEIEEIAKQLSRVKSEVEFVRSACLTRHKRLFFQPASHARQHMPIAARRGNTVTEDVIARVETEPYNGNVYDLDIEHVHNYVANDVVVHNSIYAFRGSDFRIFLNFEHDWPNAKVVKLEENYRSTATIITAASHVIANNKEQKQKTLWTKNPNGGAVTIVGLPDAVEEAFHISSRISSLFRSPNADPQVAILYRTNAQSRPIEQALIQAGIPYRIYGGLRFYDRMEIKDIIAALRFAHNPKDRVSLERIQKNFGKREAAFLETELPRLAGELKLLELIGFFLENTKYMEYLERTFKNARERIENVQELVAFAGTFDHLGISDFLEQVSLVASTDMPNGKPSPKHLSKGVVTLMTVHASKGLEFNQVFVAGCNEGLIPHEQSFVKNNEVEEERRLMYVAMTRARHELTLTYYNVPSRFLYEIPSELTDFKTVGERFRDELPDEDDRYISYD